MKTKTKTLVVLEANNVIHILIGIVSTLAFIKLILTIQEPNIVGVVSCIAVIILISLLLILYILIEDGQA
jgi:hypothetical protein